MRSSTPRSRRPGPQLVSAGDAVTGPHQVVLRRCCVARVGQARLRTGARSTASAIRLISWHVVDCERGRGKRPPPGRCTRQTLVTCGSVTIAAASAPFRSAREIRNRHGPGPAVGPAPGAGPQRLPGSQGRVAGLYLYRPGFAGHRENSASPMVGDRAFRRHLDELSAAIACTAAFSAALPRGGNFALSTPPRASTILFATGPSTSSCSDTCHSHIGGVADCRPPSASVRPTDGRGPSGRWPRRRPPWPIRERFGMLDG